jgi:hypothetical protein
MKHQYFGDVSDYFKYGLLRCFTASGVLVGVCWMLTLDDQRTDERKTNYLTKPGKWRNHDPKLFDTLAKALGEANGKHLRHAERNLFLPNTRFFGDVVPDGKSERSLWFKNAEAALAGTDLVFFDPDNGIEVPTKPRGRKNSSKYVFWDELSEIWKGGKSLLIFQHFARKKRDEYVSILSQNLAKCAPGASISPIRSPNVLFLLACHEVHRTRVDQALILLRSRWPKHFW